MDSPNWDLKGIDHADSLCWEYRTLRENQATPSRSTGWRPTDKPLIYCRLNRTTEAIIDLARIAGLDQLTHFTFQEWKYRFDVLFDIDPKIACAPEGNGPDGPYPQRITLEDFYAHLGLIVHHTTHLTGPSFDLYARSIRCRRIQNATATLLSQ